MTPDLEANKAVVRRFFATVFNAGDLAAADVLVREDYLQHSPIAAPGREGVKAFARGLRQAFPDLRLEIADLIAEGDRVVTRIVGRGTHTGGEFLGLPPKGRAMDATSIDIFRLEGGQLAEHWDVLDVQALIAQLS
jgi:steroid delta-isomerase-like uncharacterized protein